MGVILLIPAHHFFRSLYAFFQGQRSPNALSRRASIAFYLICCLTHFRRLLYHTPITRSTKHWLLVGLDVLAESLVRTFVSRRIILYISTHTSSHVTRHRLYHFYHRLCHIQNTSAPAHTASACCAASSLPRDAGRCPQLCSRLRGQFQGEVY